MKSGDCPLRLTRTLFRLTAFTVGILLAFSAYGQTRPLGENLYERLKKAQEDYWAAVATGDSLQVAERCYVVGKRYSHLGDYVTAQMWFIKSLRIREPLGPSEDIGKVYLRMAENQVMQKQYQLAMRHARRAYANFQYVHDKHGLMGANNAIAGVYELGWELNQNKPGSAPAASLDSALYYFRRAEQLALELKKPSDIAMVYTCIGTTLVLKNPSQAIPYLKKAYTINRQENQPNGIINLSQQLADCYLELGRPATAKKWLDIAVYVRDTARVGDYWQNRHIEEVYTKLYKQTGDWKQALAHQNKYYVAYIDALNADRDGAVARIETQYEREKSELKIKAQQKELALRQANLKAQQRLTRVTAILFALAGIACVVFYWLFRKFQRISSHNAKLVKEQNHRVKNNLQSITNLLGLQFNRLTDSEARRAVEESLLRVEAMALVHQRLYDGDRLVEVDVSQYIPELVNGVLRSFSFNQVQPVYRLDPIWLNADAAINLGLLLNELVTNSCKYALPFHPEPALEIGCQEEKGEIHLWFSDNGPGFIHATLKGNSFGMKLIDMVTEKLKGTSDFTMDKGCHFTLSFDCRDSMVAN